MASERPDGFYPVTLEGTWAVCEWRQDRWFSPGSEVELSNGDVDWIGPQLTPESTIPEEGSVFLVHTSDACALDEMNVWKLALEAAFGKPVHIVDDAYALAALVAYKRSLEAAFSKPVMIIDVMRVIDRFEAHQQGKCECGPKVKCEQTDLPDDRQRLIDLARYMRHQLRNDGLITNEEYAALVREAGAVQRLEDYESAIAAVKRESAEDTAGLVHMVSRYLNYHAGVAQSESAGERNTCECSVCCDARTLIRDLEAARGVKC